MLKRRSTRDVGKIQNAVQVQPIDGDYEQSTQYAQLDSSKRVLVEENYKSLNAEGYDQLQSNPNENGQQYTSKYEELP